MYPYAQRGIVVICACTTTAPPHSARTNTPASRIFKVGSLAYDFAGYRLPATGCRKAVVGSRKPRAGRMIDDQEIYSRIGEEGFTRLIAAFYRQVPGDDILAAMYPSQDLAGAQQRLRDFLIGHFGGPQRYIEQRGHPRLRVRHMPFAVNTAARERWLQLMTNALDEVKLPADVDAFLREFFDGVSAMLVNRPG